MKYPILVSSLILLNIFVCPAKSLMGEPKELPFLVPGDTEGRQNLYEFCKVIFEENDIFVELYGKRHIIEDYLDYGELQVSLFSDDDRLVVLLGLIDYYGSVYFVYYYDENRLNRLGTVHVDQSKDVEETGFKDITFKLYKEKDILRIYSYLGDEEYSMTDFEMK